MISSTDFGLNLGGTAIIDLLKVEDEYTFDYMYYRKIYVIAHLEPDQLNNYFSQNVLLGKYCFWFLISEEIILTLFGEESFG